MTEQYNITENLDSNIPSDDVESENNIAGDDLPDVVVQVEKIAERQRKISAHIQLPHPVERVWKLLTDYEGLCDFIPNLAKSSLLEHPHGGIRLEQIGSQRLLKFNFSARVVLDLEEYFPTEIKFSMIEGDFKAFSGSWYFQADASAGEQPKTHVSYTIQVWPKLTMPISIIERRLSNDLRVNLLAIHQRLEELTG